MTRLEKLRLLLLRDATDESQDALIQLLMEMADSRLTAVIRQVLVSNALPVVEPVVIPQTLAYIADELVVQRFNRIGSEGYDSQNVDGHSITFSKDDVAQYLDDIVLFLVPRKDGYTKGKAVLI